MNRNQFLLTMLVTAGIFAAGIAAGFALTRQLPVANKGDDHADDATHEEEDPEVVQLTKQAYQNLNLSVGRASVVDYTRTIRIPARVIELPGYSDHRIAAPVNGIVDRLYVRPGQAISPGEPVLMLRVIDEALLEAQLKLLEVMTQLDVNTSDTQRLTPLADAGGVSGRRLIELKYERQKLEAKERLYRQELLVRGLAEPQIDSIISEKQLVRDFVVRLPNRLQSTLSKVSDDSGNLQELSFTIEKLVAVPGTTVSRGDDLCHLAYHSSLYIEGQAFEKDLPLLEQSHEQGSPLTIEFGTDDNVYTRNDAKIEYIDNQVDDPSQTYSFYVPIENEIVSEQAVADDVLFRTWRFKPGQRAHVVLPVEQLAGHINLPADAVVEEGPNAFVFRKYVTPHADHPSDDGHAHFHPYAEFKRTPVHLIFRDKYVALVANDNQIKVGQRIAMKSAFDLNLILKTKAGAGGGHGHEH